MIVQQDWEDALARTPGPVQDALIDLARRRSPFFADVFYETMLADSDARGLLDHEDVSRRLHASMARWIESVLSSWNADQLPELVALQRHLGNVHSRIGLKIEVLLRSARRIKLAIVDELSRTQSEPEIRQASVRVAVELIDIAIEAMSEQYSNAQQAASRTGEAYRTFASSMNMSLERERQRRALTEWESQIMRCLIVKAPITEFPSISHSSFGLWARHKAGALFSSDEGLGRVLGAFDRIDGVLLPDCRRLAVESVSTGFREELDILLGEIKTIRYLVDAMFDRLIRLESGNDSLTQLLNRRFQSTILTREIEMNRQGEHPFAVMLIDIDHFKIVNDTFGHGTGDRVIQHVAGSIIATVRSGDFGFRHGGEEFLVLCVEVTDEQALKIAEKIRAEIESASISTEGANRIDVTVSIGVAGHDGHPDYQRLIERADRALLDAKAQGRNRCVLDSGWG